MASGSGRFSGDVTRPETRRELRDFGWPRQQSGFVLSVCRCSRPAGDSGGANDAGDSKAAVTRLWADWRLPQGGHYEAVRAAPDTQATSGC
jgi:hypothetical protein